MTKLGYIPGLAISRAITADELKCLEAKPYQPVTSISNQRHVSADMLFRSPYGVNAYTHSVVTWEDDQQRTILGFDPYGFIEQNGEAILPNRDQLDLAMKKLAVYVTRTLAEQAGVVVHTQAVELR